MISYTKIRRLAKGYKEAEQILFFIDEALSGNPFYLKKLNKKGIDLSKKALNRLSKYICIYKAIFLKCLDRLPLYQAQIVKDVYMKGISPCKAAMDNYSSISAVYRALKKFDHRFYYDILKTSRIINPILSALNKGNN